MIVVVAIGLLAGCATVGPDYVRPSMHMPAAFKETDGWKTARPLDEAPKGPWWEIYGVPELNALEQQVNVSNQNVAQAEAEYRAARAAVTIVRGALFPTVSASASTTRSRSSTSSRPGSAATSTVTDVGLDASWELDLWGSVRRSVESSVASAQASAADLEAMRLSMQAELAQDYFQLRALDAQQQVLGNAVADYQKSLDLTRNRYEAGVAPRSDVAQAETQLRTTQAQATDVGVARAQFEHAIAVLIGKAPAEFSLARLALNAAPPDIPVGVPSELLERRPDIAAAERGVAAANAQIGVAQAAFYPTLTLSASLGTAITSASGAGPLLWALGSSLAQTVFDGGARQGRKAEAVATYEATVASYRQTVLSAFQDVEDNLAAVRILEREAGDQASAVAAARESVTLALNQYSAGTVSYLNVLTAQQTALTNEVTNVNIASRRFVASAGLVRALGGGWTVDNLPGEKTIVGTR
jgi:NodT family efflux transporter outer membrane factor (OMF) lipoprotein